MYYIFIFYRDLSYSMALDARAPEDASIEIDRLRRQKFVALLFDDQKTWKHEFQVFIIWFDFVSSQLCFCVP